MHASSYENMRLCYERYIHGPFVEARGEVVVLDLGASNVNGSYKPIFSGPGLRYVGADLVAGKGVDMVLQDPYRIPLPDHSIDVVLSGQMMEHCEFFWLSFVEMRRVVKPDGYILVIAPSAGEIHRYPVDCYRFLPDSFVALAKYAGCHVVDIWRDDRGPWHDLVGVFRGSFPLGDAPAFKIATTSGAAPSFDDEPLHCDSSRPAQRGTPKQEARSEGIHYLDALKTVHAGLAPRGYFEIGVRRGASLALASCPAVGLDPAPAAADLPETTQVLTTTSDDYFAKTPSGPDFPVDLAFIDGMHAFEYALRDFINIERFCGPHAIVAIDDVSPNHAVQAVRIRRTINWTGDVWKLVACLRAHRPDLTLVLIDTAPTGLLLVAGLDTANGDLSRDYNAIVERFVIAHQRKQEKNGPFTPPDVLARTGALKPDDPRVAAFLALMKDCRDRGARSETVRERLAEWRAGANAN